MEGILFWVLAGAIFAGAGTWLTLRAQTATLQERVAGRDRKISELEARMIGQGTSLTLAQIELGRRDRT